MQVIALHFLMIKEIGVSYSDLKIMPATLVNELLVIYFSTKELESEEMEKMKKKQR